MQNTKPQKKKSVKNINIQHLSQVSTGNDTQNNLSLDFQKNFQNKTDDITKNKIVNKKVKEDLKIELKITAPSFIPTYKRYNQQSQKNNETQNYINIMNYNNYYNNNQNNINFNNNINYLSNDFKYEQINNNYNMIYKNNLKNNINNFSNINTNKNLEEENNNSDNESISNIILNINSSEYFPTNKKILEDSDLIENIKLNINAEEYIPSFEKLKNQEKERKLKEEREEKEKINLEFEKKEKEKIELNLDNKKEKEKEKNKIEIEKKEQYVESSENKIKEKKEYKYSLEFIMNIKNNKLSNMIEYLPKITLEHIDNFKENEKEFEKNSKNNQKNNNSSSKEENSKLTWLRKDFSKEYEAAAEFKKQLNKKIQDDPLLRDLRALLNMLTEDNYENIKNRIVEIIKNNLDYQEKFIDVFFQKATLENAYIKLYGKLCKELHKELKENNKEEKNKEKTNSLFKTKLIDKCRNIFKNNEKIYEYIKEKDPFERENKFKKYLLGNINLICELINMKILSKKIGPDSINFLFEKYEKENNEKLKLIKIEEIIIFVDKFGTLIYTEQNKINSKTLKELNEKLEDIFNKLEKIKDESTIPDYIKYKLINLIEKKKNNYEKSKYEKSIIAKSKKEVEEESKTEKKVKVIKIIKDTDITQDDINEKIKKELNEYKEYIEEENNEKYNWKEIIYLYEKQKKSFDSILEGYIISCGDFIEKQTNIKYAKKFIKELIENYNKQFNEEEKINIRKKILNLFDIAKDIAFETPKIYDIYSYTIFILIKNKIVKIKHLKNIFKEKKGTEEDYFVINNIFLNVYKYYKNYSFKDELKKIDFINSKKNMFDWIFDYEESEEEDEDEYMEEDNGEENE